MLSSFSLFTPKLPNRCKEILLCHGLFKGKNAKMDGGQTWTASPFSWHFWVISVQIWTHFCMLCNLRQGCQAVADLAIGFRTLATSSGWNTEALKGAFLQINWSYCADLKSLEDLNTVAITIDNRIRDRTRSQRAGNLRATVWTCQKTKPITSYGRSDEQL